MVAVYAMITVYSDYESGVYLPRTKMLAAYLVSNGYSSRFVQMMANGNLSLPNEVIEAIRTLV